MVKTVIHNGFVWPAEDRFCKAVVFDTVHDMDFAIEHAPGRRVVVQAGGNCGAWPVYLSNKFETVITFEPDLLNFSCLVQNVPNNVVCFNHALGDGNHKVGMVRDMKNVGAHYIEPGGEISVVTLDSVLENLEHLDYLCLDIEGYELKALLGARNLISRFLPVIQVEDKGLSQKYGTDKGAIEKWLGDNYGYRVIARPHRDVVLICDKP